jgi:hypothetical protein
MGIALSTTGRTTAIGSSKYAVLRRSVSVILIGSHGFRARRIVTLEKSSRSHTSSSMMVVSLVILAWFAVVRVYAPTRFNFLGYSTDL